MNGVLWIPLPGRPLSAGNSHRAQAGRTLVLRHFIAGPENRLTEVAVHAALAGEHGHYNPLVFYGPPSTGKSHLALGIAAEWRRRDPTALVICRTANDFAWEYAAAVENRSLDEMLQNYHQASLLVVEDLHHLAGKQAAQLELARLIEALWKNSTQVILTAQQMPQALTSLAPSLRSRASAGLAIPLRTPGEAARRQILSELATLRGLALASDATDLLARSMAGTVRDLLSALITLEATGNSTHISTDAVRSFLDQQAHRPQPSIEAIATEVARHFGIALGDLRSASRRQTVATARSVAVYLARELTDSSLKRIGQFFGNRDHTTMLHACRRAEQRIEQDAETRRTIEQLRSRFATSPETLPAQTP